MSLIKIERRVFSRVFRKPSRFWNTGDPIFTPVKYRGVYGNFRIKQ